MAKKLTPAQVKARSKDPRTRTSVPTSQLSPAHQKMRARARAHKARQAALDDPAALTAPMTPRTLAEQVNASTGLAFSGQEQEIAGQRGVHGQMMTNIPSWFDQYQASLARSTAIQMAASAQAVAASQQAGDSAAALDASQRGVQQSSMAADAATRGATVDPALAAQAQQAAAARHSSQAAFTGLQAGLGAASTGLAANRETVAAGQRLSAQTGERNVGLNIDRAAQILAKDKGRFATEFRQKLIDAEHTKQLERSAFGLAAKKAEDDVRIETTKIKAKAKQDRIRNDLKRIELRAEREMDAATRSNNRERIRIAQENLKIARRRARAYERGQQAAAQGVPTVAQAAKRNTSVRKVEGEISKARTLLGKMKVKDPENLRILLDDEFNLPKEARELLVAQIIGREPGGAPRGTAARRYREYLARIRRGEINYP